MKACVYCGATDNLTDDHIPPKNLFPRPRPSNLITVPACLTCHSTTSKDDENFRLRLCMSEQVGRHSEAKKAREAAFRALLRPQARGFKAGFLSDVRQISLWTQSGL